MVTAGLVVQGHSRLLVGDKGPEGYRLASIIHASSLHNDAPGQEFLVLKNRRHPVADLAPGIPDIGSHNIFQGQHSILVKGPSPSHEVEPVVIFPGELVGNEVAAVVEGLAIYKVILLLLPPCGVDLGNISPLFPGSRIWTNQGIGRSYPV